MKFCSFIEKTLRIVLPQFYAIPLRFSNFIMQRVEVHFCGQSTPQQATYNMMTRTLLASKSGTISGPSFSHPCDIDL